MSLDPDVRRMVVHFEGEGSGVAEMSWGQLEIMGAMRRARTWMPLHNAQPLPAGTTVEDVADWVRYVMSRHQGMRTRLRPRPDGPPEQVLYASGDIALNIVEAGGEDPAEAGQRMTEEHNRCDFDFARDWPILVAVILANGAAVYQVITVSHIVTDAFGALALAADLANRDAAGGRPPPVTTMQPLEQARWQRSPAGQRHNAATLRHWEAVLRAMPAARFPAPADRGEPRYWNLTLVSPATHLALQIIRRRTGAGSGQVILALFMVALARTTGVNPAVTRVAVNNRFRRGLADSVSVVTQYGLCMVDVGGITFDETVERVGRRMMATLKYAYYDPAQLAALVDRVSRERGEEVDVHCYYNNRRLSQDDALADDPPPVAADVLAARGGTRLDQEPHYRPTERLFAAVEEEPGSFRLTLEADTRYLSREAMVALARAVEDVAVAAAQDAGTPNGWLRPRRSLR